MSVRARKPEDKAARRETILAVAAGALRRREYAQLTMAELAEACGLAKGTLYLYFGTKEELFLATLERELAQWFDDLGAELLRVGPHTPRSFATTVARGLAGRPTLVELLPLLHTVLEHNLGEDTALGFKRMLRDKLLAGGRLVEAVLSLREGDGARLLLRAHAVVVGLRQLADPPPQIRGLLEREELALLRVDFEHELAETLAAMVAGMTATRHLRAAPSASDRT